MKNDLLPLIFRSDAGVGADAVAYDPGFALEGARFHIFARYNETGSGVMTHPDLYSLDSTFWMKTKYLLNPVSNIPSQGAIAVPVGLLAGPLATIGKSQAPSTRVRPWQCQSVTIEERTVLRFPKGVTLAHVPASVSFTEGPY